MTAVSMVVSRVSREIETLEAEMKLALSDASVPLGKRAELEERLSAIKAKADTATGGGDSNRTAPSLED